VHGEAKKNHLLINEATPAENEDYDISYYYDKTLE